VSALIQADNVRCTSLSMPKKASIEPSRTDVAPFFDCGSVPAVTVPFGG